MRGRRASVRLLSDGKEVKMPLQPNMSRAGFAKNEDVDSGAGKGREEPGQRRLPVTS